MPSSREPVRGGVRAYNDGGGTDVSIEKTGAGRVQRLRKGVDGRVIGYTLHDIAWKNQGEMVELNQHSYGGGRGGANNISDSVPQGGDAGVSSGRLPGKGQDEDGDEGAFLAPACPGCHDHLEVGEPPSSKMPTMRYAGPVALTKWMPQEYGDVQEWGGEEEVTTGGGGGKRNRGDGFRGLREAATVGT